MMRPFPLANAFWSLLLLALIPTPTRADDVPFEMWFAMETLRLDYYHIGDAASEEIIRDRMQFEGPWAGSRQHLTDALPMGQHRFALLDAASGTLLYQVGFSSLFAEWQSTPEAKQTRSVFHETVRFPRPLKPAVGVFYSRNRKGKMKRVTSLAIDPSSHNIGQINPDRPLEKVLLHRSGDPTTCLDFVIVADGYPESQRDKALGDMKRYASVLLESEPYDRHVDRINIMGVLPEASANGPDEPRKARFTSPPAGTRFNTFDSPRYLTTTDNRQLRDLAGAVPYDVIVVLVNTSRYGGAGIYNQFAIFVSDNEFDEYVFLHELGHSLAGLGDEYYTSSTGYEDFYPSGVEPWEPNVTAMLDGPSNLKWKDLVTSGIPVPTPDQPEFDGQVGAVEGAGYCAHGLYRPSTDCRMYSKRHREFCPVCMRAVESVIRLYTE